MFRSDSIFALFYLQEWGMSICVIFVLCKDGINDIMCRNNVRAGINIEIQKV